MSGGSLVVVRRADTGSSHATDERDAEIAESVGDLLAPSETSTQQDRPSHAIADRLAR
jgi:hypothetical protein